MPNKFFKTLLFIALALSIDAQCADHVARTWTNVAGIKREATFVSADGNKVTLLLNNGQMINMDLDKLSSADQEYIRSLDAKEEAPAPAPMIDTAVESPPPAATPAASVASAPGSDQGAAMTPRPRKPSLLNRPGLIRAPDPEVKPNAEIYITFPELGKSHTAEPMGMHIRIPKNYRPDRPVPLLIWLAGGDGNNTFNNVLTLVNPDDFVIAGMNYPASVSLPEYAFTEPGGIEKIWDVHEKMLLRLQQMIPNIDPRLRIIAGFSNGAHVIGGCLAQQINGMYDYFNVYVMIEGGQSLKYNYPSLPGRFCYIADGAAKGGYGAQFNQILTANARKAQMKVESHLMEGFGHDFPDSEKAKVNTWLRGVMIEQLSKP